MNGHLPSQPYRGSGGTAGAALVQAVPYRDGPWTSGEMLCWGRTLESPVGGFGLGGDGTVVSVFENSKSFGPPKAYVLNLSVLNQQPAAIVQPGVIRAVINAGTGAGRETFEVDWRNGVSIGLSAGNVTVTARQDGNYAHQVLLGATLAEGAPLARSLSPTWSIRPLIALVGAVARIAVPRRARTVRVASAAGALTQCTLTALQVAAPLFLTLDQWALPAEQQLRTVGVPLPEWTTHVELTVVGVPLVTGWVEFGLDC